MALVPVADTYTDTATPPWRWLTNTPIGLGAGRFLVTTAVVNSTGPIGNVLRRLTLTPTPLGSSARVYSLTTTGWTRGNPAALPMDVTTARAGASTVEGKAVIQGSYQANFPVAGQVTSGVAVAFGATVALSRVSTHAPPFTSQSMSFRVTAPLWLNSVTFHLAADGSTDTGMKVNITTPTGTVLSTTGAFTVDGSAATYTKTFPRVRLDRDTWYWVTFTGAADGSNPAGDTGRLGTADLYGANGGHGDYFWDVATQAPYRYIEGVQQSSSFVAIWYSLHYDQVDSYTVNAPQNGYAVLDVQGTVVTAGTPTYAEAGFSTSWGDLDTGPDAMVRIPGTNRFWAWRSYPSIGIVAIDLFQVTGLDVTMLATTHVNTSAGYVIADTPHKIIPISATEAISMLTFTGTVLFVHMKYDGTTTPVVTVQSVPGYGPASGATLVTGARSSGALQQAEVMFKILGSDPLSLIRLGVNWTGTAFVVAALPITQLTAKIVPPSYTPRSKTAHIAMVSGSAAVSFGGYVVIARAYIDNGSDDNWVLLTQYDQSNGTIVANTWAKGDVNGAMKDHLYSYAPALIWEASTERLIYADVERWDRQAQNTVQASPRLGVFRMSYKLDQAARSQRERFER